MTGERVTARAFHDAEGVQDWRVLFGGAHAHFKVGTFQEGARFLAAIADIAEEIGHFPDIDVRPEGVTVRVCSRADGALGQRDVELARRISEVARQSGLAADPSGVTTVNIALLRTQRRMCARSGRRLLPTGPDNHGVDIAAWPDFEDHDDRP